MVAALNGSYGVSGDLVQRLFHLTVHTFRYRVSRSIQINPRVPIQQKLMAERRSTYLYSQGVSGGSPLVGVAWGRAKHVSV